MIPFGQIYPCAPSDLRPCPSFIPRQMWVMKIWVGPLPWVGPAKLSPLFFCGGEIKVKEFLGRSCSLYPLVSGSPKKSKVMDLSWATHVALIFFWMQTVEIIRWYVNTILENKQTTASTWRIITFPPFILTEVWTPDFLHKGWDTQNENHISDYMHQLFGSHPCWHSLIPFGCTSRPRFQHLIS